MNLRTDWSRSALAAVCAVALAQAGCNSGGDGPAASASPMQTVAKVQLANVEKKEFGERLQVYGEVVPAPAAEQTLSAKTQAVVASVDVRVGQHVSQGQTLVELRPSPETSLSVDQARANVEQERKKLEAAKHRRELHLATNSEVASARQAYEQARLQLQSLRSRGGAETTSLRAPQTGVVSSVSTQEGAVVNAGDPLVVVAQGGDVELSVGVEPEDVVHVKRGQKVTFSALHAPRKQHPGQVRAVAGVVRPDTRLVPVYVDVSGEANLLVGQPVEAIIPVEVHEALVVPRSAVLPTDDHMKLFTVRQGRAVAHTVQVGLESDQQVEIVEGDIAAGDSVVVQGNYELEDGMRVRTGEAP